MSDFNIIEIDNDIGTSTVTDEGGGVIAVDVDVKNKQFPLVLDSSARLRVGTPYTLFDSKQINNNQILFWDDVVSGNGTITYRSSESSSRLQCSTVSGDKAIRQTKEYFNYQAGKSLRITMTGVVGSPKTGVRQRIGFFDENNGIFIEQLETGIKIVKRTNTSGSVEDFYENQADWNIDPMNGSGKSGLTVNLAKAQIFVFDIQWLGVGRVRVGLVIDGEVFYLHEFLHWNQLTNVYMRTPNLPIRYEIENISTTVSSTYLDAICSEVESESGYNPKGFIRTVTTGINRQIVGATYTPVLSLRLKDSFKKAQAFPISFKLYNSSNTLVHCKLVFNGILTGASWTSVSDTAITEYDTTATSLTGGETIDDLFVSSQGSDRSQLSSSIPESIIKLGSNYAGEQDTLTIIAKSDGANSSIYSSITYKEVY